MIEAAEKLIETIEVMQEQAKILAKISVLHGAKIMHKDFWENRFVELQERALQLVKEVELYEPPEIDLPFKSSEFKKVWSDYCLSFYQEKGIMIGQKRQQYILHQLNDNYETDEQAIKALKHHILKADIPTYKVNFTVRKIANTTNEEQVYEEFN